MRILIAGQAYFREDNGQAVFTVRLARGLAAAGHAVSVLAPAERGAAAHSRLDGVCVHRLPALRLPHNANVTLFHAARVRRLLGEAAPDIVHLQDHYFLSRATSNAAVQLGIPVVGTNHFLPRNLTANLPLPRGLQGVLDQLLWRHMRGVYDRLEAVSAPTGTAAAILEGRGLVPPVTAISCGVDTRRFQPGPAEDRLRLRHRLNLGRTAKIFLFVGRLDGEKGLEEVIKGFAGLSGEASRHACLVLAGRGSRLEKLRALAASLGQGHRVLFPGFVPAGDLPGLYRAADCFVMAGHAELQSIATLEAMACGLPVLAANACALPELVTPLENGLLFEPGSVSATGGAMAAMLAMEERWTTMGEASRARALSHDLRRSIEHYHTWYRRVTGPGGARIPRRNPARRSGAAAWAGGWG